MRTTKAAKKIARTITNNWLTKRITIIRGGQGAGKTYGILQTIISIAQVRKMEIIIASAELTKMRLTVIKDFVSIMRSFNVFNFERWKAGTEYSFENGSFVKFIGLDKADVGKGLRSDLLFINEANKTTYEMVHELISRAKRKIFDYNPNSRFWVDDNFRDREDVQEIVLTYKDNEFLSNEERSEIETYKIRGFINPNLEKYDTEKNIKSNFWANKWRVYGMGQYGKIDGLIYQDWKIGKFDETLPHRFGLDFGFFPDPDALVKVAIDEKRKKIYVHECFYKTGQNTDKLISSIKRHCKKSDLIIADSAESRLISDLKSHFNIRSTIKWHVPERIKKVQSYELIVTPTSKNLITELESYIWDDKKSGTPIDKYNHLLDALGYAVTGMKKFNFSIK